MHGKAILLTALLGEGCFTWLSPDPANNILILYYFHLGVFLFLCGLCKTVYNVDTRAPELKSLTQTSKEQKSKCRVMTEAQRTFVLFFLLEKSYLVSWVLLTFS